MTVQLTDHAMTESPCAIRALGSRPLPFKGLSEGTNICVGAFSELALMLTQHPLPCQLQAQCLVNLWEVAAHTATRHFEEACQAHG